MYEACGFASTCGRPLGHRGHHGGWQTGVRAAEPGPFPGDFGEIGSQLAPAEVRLLAEYAYHGALRDAADCLGQTVSAMKHVLTVIHNKTGDTSSIGSLVRLGWVTFPPGALSHAA